VIGALLYVVFSVLRVLELLLLGRILAGWLSADRSNFIVRICFETTEPVLALVRPWTRRVPGPLDWAPWLVLVLIEAMRMALASLFS
jgi:uncharacterized protein YggT (Ycf19 family)